MAAKRSEYVTHFREQGRGGPDLSSMVSILLDHEHAVLESMVNVFAAMGGGIPSQWNVRDLTQEVNRRTGCVVQQKPWNWASKRPLLKMEHWRSVVHIASAAELHCIFGRDAL